MSLWALLLCLSGHTLVFHHRAAGSFFVAERGPHHKRWIQPLSLPGHGNQNRWITNEFVELATGLHSLERNRWVDSRDLFEAAPGLAVARLAPHQVKLHPNPNQPGSLEVRTPDGKLLRAHVLGVAYTDDRTRQSVLLAWPKDSQGVIHPPNRVYYPDALEGDARGDLRYTQSKHGLEQDLILRQAPPVPESFGMDRVTTYIELWTEFLDPPTPALRPRPRPPRGRGTAQSPPEASEFQPEPEDVDVDFGAMIIGAGRAYWGEDASDPFESPPILITKLWEQIGRRSFLIERTPYTAVAEWLKTLATVKTQHSISRPRQARAAISDRAHFRPYPQAPEPDTSQATEFQVADASAPRSGLVLDFMLSNQSLSNHVFRSGTTTLISGMVHLSGLTTIEGSAVLKFSRGGAAYLDCHGPIDCRTDALAPATFTAYDDDTVGITLPDSTGDPKSDYALYALALRSSSGPAELRHLRVRHARYGLAFHSGVQATARHLQLAHLTRGIAWQPGCRIHLCNFLLENAGHAWWGLTADVAAHHGTLCQVNRLALKPYPVVALTNCILVQVTNALGWIGDRVVVESNADSIFESAGLGKYYLPEHSVHRGQGVSSLGTDCLAELESRTTQAPVVLSGSSRRSMQLDPPAVLPREGPDPGYHYPSLHFLLRGLHLDDAKLQLAGGVVVGLDPSEHGFGLKLLSGSELDSDGEPHRLNRFVAARLIQESTPRPVQIEAMLAEAAVATRPAAARFRFTTFHAEPGGMLWLPEVQSDALTPWILRDCQLHQVDVRWQMTLPGSSVVWANNLFREARLELRLGAYASAVLRQNLFLKGLLHLEGHEATCLISENVFIETGLERGGGVSLVLDSNGYLANQPRWQPSSPTEVLLSQPIPFAVGPFGLYYYAAQDPISRPLLDAAGITAAQAGLAHYTVLDSQLPEGVSQLDIGWHQVACAGQIPLDDDQDALANYLEDANGDLLLDPGETDPTLADSDSDSVPDGVERALGLSPDQPGTIVDTQGELGLIVFTPFEAVTASTLEPQRTRP